METYWNNPKWRAIHNGARTVEKFLVGTNRNLLTTNKYSLVVFNWEQDLKSKYEGRIGSE